MLADEEATGVQQQYPGLRVRAANLDGTVSAVRAGPTTTAENPPLLVASAQVFATYRPIASVENAVCWTAT